jgi:hypothetical protein
MMPIQAMLYRKAGAVVDATVSFTPDGASVSKTNSTVYSQNVTANITNGVGPFTYQWTHSNPTRFTLSNATSATCTLQGGGYTNVEYLDDLTLTITDTGNGNKTATHTATFDVAWGTPV